MDGPVSGNWPFHHAFLSSRSLLPTKLPPFPRLLQLPVALGVDLLLPPRQHVLRSEVADALFNRTLL
jgi:hypothetical protein